ncbi:MAG: C40 family peptidase [Terriglobia bacterium]
MLIRELICDVARSYLGCPYRWAGQYPWPGATRQHGGLDCSGFVIRVLRPFGLLPARGDWTADQLSRLFEETLNPQPGDLAVYGSGRASPERNRRVTHIGFYLANRQVISAAGGNSRTTTLAAARRRGARVKIHRASYRRDLLGYRDITRKLSEV